MNADHVERLRRRRDELEAHRARLVESADEVDEARRDQLVRSLDSMITRLERLIGAPPGKPAKAKSVTPLARLFELSKVRRTERAEIRVSLNTRYADRRIDVRLWFAPRGDSTMVPSRKGLLLTADELDELIPQLQAARQRLSQA